MSKLKTSSIKRHHARGLYGAFSTVVASSDLINRVAQGGTILVPMAEPCFCRKNCLSNSKLLFFKVMLMREAAYCFRRWSVSGAFVKVFPGSLDAFKVKDIGIERDVQRDRETVVREIIE